MDNINDLFSSLVQELFGLPKIHKAPRDNVGRPADSAGLPVYYGNDNEHSVFCQILPVSQHNFAHIPDSKSVDHDVVGRHRSFLNCELIAANIKNLTVFY